MNLIRKQLYSQGFTYNRFAQFSYQKNIQVNLCSGKLSLNIDFPNKEKKIFFLDNSFTFGHLKDLINLEYPNYKIDYDFSNTQKSKNYDIDSKVASFIDDGQQGIVNIQIQENEYQLKNTGNYSLNNEVDNLWNQGGSDIYGINVFKTCIENKIKPSHAGVLSHFLKKFITETQKYGSSSNLTDKEIDDIFKKCISDFSDPVKQDLELLYAKRNELESQMNLLQKERQEVEDAATKRINMYIKLVLLVSVAHITSFYYMIFHVEWLGWDIIEPLTYSVGLITTLLGIRFYRKYKQDRGFDVMQNIWKQKMIMKNRNVRDRYEDILGNITRKENAIKHVNTHIDILKNRKNYTQFSRDSSINY